MLQRGSTFFHNFDNSLWQIKLDTFIYLGIDLGGNEGWVGLKFNTLALKKNKNIK